MRRFSVKPTRNVPIDRARHASGAGNRFAHLLKNAPRVLGTTGDAQLHAARRPVEQLEPQLDFQILYLRGQGGLGDIVNRCAARR